MVNKIQNLICGIMFAMDDVSILGGKKFQNIHTLYEFTKCWLYLFCLIDMVRQGLMTSKTNNISKDVGCGSDRVFRTVSTVLHTGVSKTIVKGWGYIIHYKGCFHKKRVG